MHAQTRTSDPIGGRVLTTLILGALLGLAALGGMTGSAQAAQSHGGGPYFGAIAVDRTDGTFGVSFNFRTRSAAEARARRECAVVSDSRPEGCRNVVWVRNGCAAVAMRRRSDGSLSRIGWAFAATRNRAQSRALTECGTGCRLLTGREGTRAVTCTAR